MGKSRTRGNGGDEETSYVSSFTGEEVPSGKLTESQMNNFNDKMNDWLHYYSHNPDEDLNSDELSYVFSHFLATNNNPDIPDGHLYRFENAYHFEDNDYHVGDKLEGNGSLRSFSKNIHATNAMLDDRFNGYDNIVIYRTVNNSPYFDVGKHANPFPEQEEVLVPLDTMRVTGVSRYSGSGMRDEIYGKYGIDLGDYQYFLENVTVVDVSYDSTVNSVVDVNGRTIDTSDIF